MLNNLSMTVSSENTNKSASFCRICVGFLTKFELESIVEFETVNKVCLNIYSSPLLFKTDRTSIFL